MEECCQGYRSCLDVHATLPTRILDADVDEDTIRLVNGLGRKGLYVCLSYCVSTQSFLFSCSLIFRQLLTSLTFNITKK